MSRNSQNVLYTRVSTTDQTTARQEVNADEFDRVFTDHCSGKDANRPGLAACLDYLRDGDVLTVHSIDRLARNLSDLQRLVDSITAKGASVHFLKESLTFSSDQGNAMNRLLFQVMGAFAEFERNLIHERQAEGIAIAKAAGKFRGGQPKLDAREAVEIRTRHKAGESVASLARAFNVTRATVYKYLAE